MATRAHFKIFTLALLASSIGLPSIAMADDQIHGMFAAGVASKTDYEGSDDYELSPLLAAKLQYQTYYVEALGTDIRANISPYPTVEFGPSISYSGGRDDDVENNTISRMREIDNGFEAGAFIKVPFNGVFSAHDTLSFKAEVLTDISDTHEGMLVNIGAGYDRKLNDQLTLGTSVQTTYASEDYNQTYFGIDADNAARSGLAQYDADAGFKDVSLKVKGQYMLNEHWGVLGMAGYKQIIGDAADSPIVDEEGNTSQWVAGLGLSYKF